jgi:aconitate hydratase
MAQPAVSSRLIPRRFDYLRFTGRAEDRIALVEAYAKEQGMWRDANTPDPVFTDTLELDLTQVVPSLAGPKRPQDRIALSDAASAFRELARQCLRLRRSC